MKLSLYLTLLLLITSCGIKGKPLPPLDPAPLGQGIPKKADSKSSAKAK